MKKVLAILLVCFAVAAAVNAQDKAIGLKLGNGIEISGQMNMGDANRVEANIGFMGGLDLNGYYQWVQDFPKLGDNWKWYYGGGACIGIGSSFNLGVSGQIGLEFDLQSVVPSLPLQLTLDATPTIYLIRGAHSFFDPKGGLGVRYRF
jgi:hypothetical protein